jgi:AcrR family transcriptional regulator
VTGVNAPRKRFSRAERGRQILDAAVAVFAERGFHSASMDAVAERVGVTKPVLYDHFGSKEGLLLGCIARAREELLDVTSRAAAAATDPEQMLRLGVRAFFDYLDSNSPAWTLLYQEAALPNGDGADSLEGIRAQQTDFIAALLAAQVPGAEAVRVQAWAQVMVGACERLAVWRRGTTGARVDAEQATEYLMDLMWTGLGTFRGNPAVGPSDLPRSQH